MGINVPFTEVFIYTTELYPTSMRNAGLGATSMWARISSMVAPFVNQLVRTNGKPKKRHVLELNVTYHWTP